MKRLLFLTGIISATVLVSCKKEDHHNHGEGAPKITILAPTDDATFGFSDTINIEATISHDIEMHTYKVWARQTEDNSQVMIKNEHDHSENININTWFYPNVSSHKHYYIMVEAEDHDGNTAIDSVMIHIDN